MNIRNLMQISLLICFLFAAPVFAGNDADIIYHGGSILTMNDAQPRAEAIAVSAGKILAVGSSDSVMKHKGGGTRVVDIAGKALIPGFVDAHGHVFLIGIQALSANMLPSPDGEVNDIASLQRVLKSWADSNAGVVKKVNLIVGFGYDDAQLKELRHPTRDDLDNVSTDIPVYIIHQSGHLGVGNSKALEVVGLTSASKDPKGGVIRRKEGSNEPNGVLEENAHIPVIIKLLSAVDERGSQAMFQAGMDLISSYGYTTAQDGRTTPGQAKLMRSVADKGELEIDIVSYPDVLMPNAREMIESEHSLEYRNRFRIGGGKLTIDGSPQGFTAWRDRPYYNPPENFRSDYVGYPAATNDQVMDAIDWAYANHIQVLTHSNGEAASDLLIAATKEAIRKHGQTDRRAVLIHGQFLREDQVDSIKALGIFPSLFPMHTFYWGDWHRDRTVGPVNADNISPTGWVLKRGMKFSSHHDAPVAFPDSMRLLDATVTRRSRSGDIIGPSHRVDVMTALKAMTIWPAYQHFEEGSKGSIEIGKLADLVILSNDPTAIDPETLDQLKVLETIKEGKTIYSAKLADASIREDALDSCAGNESCFGAATISLSTAGLIHVHGIYREHTE
jgi:predicted amidohydrolase YtcJ